MIKINIILAACIFGSFVSASNNYVSVITKYDNSYTNEVAKPLKYNTIPSMNGYQNSLGTAISKSEYNFSNDYYPDWRAQWSNKSMDWI